MGKGDKRKKKTAEFVGREDLLNKVFQSIETGTAITVLNGAEGAGKSAIVERIVSRLKSKKYEVIIFHGFMSAEMVLKHLAQHAAREGVVDADKIFEARIEYKEKLDKLLENYLLKKKFLLVFEDFELNLDENGQYLNERLKELISFLIDTLKEKESHLLIATRIGISDQESLLVEPLSFYDFKKFVSKMEMLQGLTEKSIKSFHFEMGGYPRTVQMFDQIATFEFRKKPFKWSLLRDRIPGLADRVLHKENEDADFTNLLLERLLGYLEENRRKPLRALAVYRGWVPKQALEDQGVHFQVSDRKELERLFHIRYLTFEGEEGYEVPRLISQAIRSRMSDDELKEKHRWAAKYFSKFKFDENHIEARWHYLKAGDIDDFATITFEMDPHFCSIGYPQFAFDLIRELVDYAGDMSEKNRLYLHNRLGILYSLFGKLDDALIHHRSAKELNQAADNKEGMGINLGQMGMIYEAHAKYDEALQHLELSLAIYKELGDQMVVAQRLEQIGSIQKQQGNYDVAFESYTAALAINRDKNNLQSIAANLEQLGRIHDEQGKFDQALDYYKQSLEAKDKTQDKKGIASLSHQVGNVHFVKGDLQQEQSLADFEKADEKKGMAAGYHQVGRVHQTKGDIDTALTNYKKAMELREEIGDLMGSAITYGQLGIVYYDKEEYETALRYAVQAYAIFTKFGSPNVQLVRQNMHKIKTHLPEETFNKILEEYNIKQEQGQ
jgi:tetratricopeptide (TPR) repeat protein